MDLTVIIPARNEEFLGKTIEDVLSNSEANTEVIAVLDGYLPDPPLKPDPRVTIIYNPVAVGQRIASNQAGLIAKGKYIMKLDAHCAMDKGFDRKMLEAFKETGDNVTMIPMMKNLHAFDWVCENGHRRYQSPSGVCEECGKPTTKDVVWIAKSSPNNVAFRFDKTMHFQYWGEYQNKHPEDLVETLSIQGSCFMCTKEKYFELGLCGEEFHSWGQQGVEVACKTWLSGGRVIGNRRTWYAHMFRTRGGDFGFPYENPQDKVNENRELSRNLFLHDQWPKATKKFQWLMDKFNPPDWGVTKGAIYYTDNKLDEKIAKPCRERIQKITAEKNMGLVSSSLKKMDMGYKNVRFPSLKRGYLTMFKQILGALENSKDDIIFFLEHDLWYSDTHLDFVPEDKNTFYYNTNVWRVRLDDGHALKTDDCKQLSGLCVNREAAITHFRERYQMAEQKYKELVKDGDETEFNRWIRQVGFEPFTHNRIQWQNQFKCGEWQSEQANLDLKHGKNATGERWKKEQYKNQKWTEGWTERENDIPKWGDIKPILDKMR